MKLIVTYEHTTYPHVLYFVSAVEVTFDLEKATRFDKCGADELLTGKIFLEGWTYRIIKEG